MTLQPALEDKKRHVASVQNSRGYGTGMFAGVMLAIKVILGGYGKSLPPADFLD